MTQQINLFNPIFLKQKHLFSATTLLQSAALVLLGAVALGIYANVQSAQIQKNADIITAQLHNAEAQVATLRAQAGVPIKSKTLEDSIAKLDGELQARQQLVDVLQASDFGSLDGYAEYLAAFARQVPQGLWLTGFSIAGAGSELGLQGRALKADLLPLYVSQLKREPILVGKSFSTLKMSLPPSATDSNGNANANTKQAQLPYIEFDLHAASAAKVSDNSGAKAP